MKDKYNLSLKPIPKRDDVINSLNLIMNSEKSIN